MGVKIRHKVSGREATVTNAAGRALVKMGRHEYVDAEASPVDQPTSEPEQAAPEEKPKRAYRRRDMRAEG